MPIGLSPPFDLPLPPCPNLPSLLPFPFPWSVVPTEPRDLPCFTSPRRVHAVHAESTCGVVSPRGARGGGGWGWGGSGTASGRPPWERWVRDWGVAGSALDGAYLPMERCPAETVWGWFAMKAKWPVNTSGWTGGGGDGVLLRGGWGGPCTSPLFNTTRRREGGMSRAGQLEDGGGGRTGHEGTPWGLWVQ